MIKGKNNTDKEKDHDKFNEIYRIHGKYLYGIGMNILQNEDHVDEALQQCYIKIYENIDKIDDVNAEKAKAYFCVIMQNESNNIFRAFNKINKKRHMTTAQQDKEFGDELSRIADENAEVEEILARAEINQTLLDCFDELEEDQRQLIIMRCLRNYPYEELADVLNISQEAARQRVHRAKEKLAEIIREKKEEA